MSTEVMKPKNEVVSSVPDYLQLDEQGDGLGDVSKFVTPPRMKIVQKQSGKPFSDQFAVGDVVLVPTLQLIAATQLNDKGKPKGEGTPFAIVPIFFFPEWLLVNPIDLKGSVKMIADRSLDETSKIAQMARNPNLRQAPYIDAQTGQQMAVGGKPLFQRYIESLSFVSMIVGDHELNGTVAVMSYSKGEHRSGSNFLQLIKQRKAKMFGCQFMIQTRLRPDNGKGDWYGYDASQPSVESGVKPFVDADTYALTRDLHEKFKQAHADRVLVVDHEDDDLAEQQAAEKADGIPY
jgi:hypothetical protein